MNHDLDLPEVLPEYIAFDYFEFFVFDFNLFWRSDQSHNFMIIIKRLFIRQGYSAFTVNTSRIILPWS